MDFSIKTLFVFIFKTDDLYYCEDEFGEEVSILVLVGTLGSLGGTLVSKWGLKVRFAFSLKKSKKFQDKHLFSRLVSLFILIKRYLQWTKIAYKI